MISLHGCLCTLWCAWCLMRPEDGGSSGTGITGSFESPCGCWKSHLGRLEEQSLLLIPESSFQIQLHSSSIDRHLGSLHKFTIVNNSSISIYMHVICCLTALEVNREWHYSNHQYVGVSMICTVFEFTSGRAASYGRHIYI